MTSIEAAVTVVQHRRPPRTSASTVCSSQVPLIDSVSAAASGLLNVATSPPVAARRVAPVLQAKPKSLGEVAERVAGSALPPAVVCGRLGERARRRARARSRRVPAIALDHRPWALGFRSRYALPLLAPDPLPDEDGFIELLLELADVLGRPAAIFPTHDEHLNSLARRADDPRGPLPLAFPSWDVLEPLQSKRHQIVTAEKLGLGAPATAHPRSADEAQAEAREIGFPVFVKPSDNIVFKRLHKRQAFM